MMHCGYFDITQNGNHSCFLTPTVVGGQRPFPVKYLPKVTLPLRKTPTSRHRLMFYAGPAWHIPIQVVVPSRPISPCFSCLTNSYGVSDAWPALHRTTDSADNCTMNFVDVGTAHSSCTISLH